MAVIRRCELCLYMSEKDGTCRCNAPAVIQPSVATEYWRPQWPKVYADDWCGEFTTKEEK